MYRRIPSSSLLNTIAISFLGHSNCTSLFFFSLAQVLQTVTEDNVPVVMEICSSPQHLGQLESLLQERPTDDPVAKSLQLFMRTCIAGNED